ncbi:hypothetical protein J31TS4_47180 [Paenibacillus sp. J31TS4]|uniref:DEAD/DEAH box helicase n=1 Tax=Paenibacillus sp. J31TS4 TaxID=2807195 RepID=UPI001B2A30A7|nr:DEAD/DEAH box helicase [Paenibacillus sp. J31TS4]GIP41438.1 hypothetical protein J31TS4_47180 [Paenibacillus sp. J31TS4]
MPNPFTAFGISSELNERLRADGIVHPTPVQEQAIPAILSGRDVVAQAQTGTGKTLAFVLPILQKLNPRKKAVQALIISPTRELALQITEETSRLGPVVDANVLAVYGGQDVERQLKRLEDGSVHVIVGTPGRLLDHLRRGSIHFGKLDVLVLDEADQMLHMGFLAEVEELIAQTSSDRQTLLFSATMPEAVRSLARRYTNDPVDIRIDPERRTVEAIEQVVIQTTDRQKLDALCKAVQEQNPYLAMIFCRTKVRASKLNASLQERGFLSDELHGDLTQAKREQVMKRFREAKIQLLVATDMAARGLDVEGVTHVYNYDIPHDTETYIHRIGRTGRAGERGVAVTFAAPRDAMYLEKIERGMREVLRKEAAQVGARAAKPGGAGGGNEKPEQGRRGAGTAARAGGRFAKSGNEGGAGRGRSGKPAAGRRPGTRSAGVSAQPGGRSGARGAGAAAQPGGRFAKPGAEGGAGRSGKPAAGGRSGTRGERPGGGRGRRGR